MRCERERERELKELFVRIKDKRSRKGTRELTVNSDFENWKFMEIVIFHRDRSINYIIIY